MTRQEYKETLFKTYSLVSVLSRKNGGEVFRLRHKSLNRDIVMRSYQEQLDAYGSLLKIECQNLPVIYDCITLDDGQIILEEFIDGITVFEAIEAEKFTYRKAKKVMQGVLNALFVLHSLGFVHRDVKPENVMLTGEGRVVLLDFNASRLVKTEGNDTVVLGTIGYASPEQLGISQSGARADLYACGILLNVMLTGVHPSETIANGRAGKIVRKCTAVNPDDRYKDAKSLFGAL